MKTTLISLCIASALLIGGFFLLNSYIYNEKQGAGLPDDFKEVLFSISGEPVSLKEGAAEVRTNLGGSSKTTVRYFGNELMHDVDGDDIEDTVFLVTQETESGNEYFYLVAALKREDGYLGSQAVLIGDRIAPQTVEKGEGRIVIVNYAQSSVGKSLYLLLDPETLEFGQVVQGFEGEER